MQQRRLRLGDVIDDYCPRERRITNHAVVAMIEDTVKQTRCTTCDADHEYKHAKTPARRKKTVAPVGKLVAPEAEELHEEMTALSDVPESDESGAEESGAEIAAIETSAEAGMESDETGEQVEQSEQQEQPELAAAAPADEAVESEEVTSDDEKDNWPVHRPLIRAQLPRPEGHTPERKAPDFTFRPAGGRFDQNRSNGQRHRGGGGGGAHRQGGGGRQAQGGQPGQGGSRFGGQRGPGGPGGHGGGPQGQRHGSNRPGQGGGGNRPGQGQGRGPRPGGGRKRGR